MNMSEFQWVGLNLKAVSFSSAFQLSNYVWGLLFLHFSNASATDGKQKVL